MRAALIQDDQILLNPLGENVQKLFLDSKKYPRFAADTPFFFWKSMTWRLWWAKQSLQGSQNLGKTFSSWQLLRLLEIPRVQAASGQTVDFPWKAHWLPFLYLEKARKSLLSSVWARQPLTSTWMLLGRPGSPSSVPPLLPAHLTPSTD